MPIDSSNEKKSQSMPSAQHAAPNTNFGADRMAGLVPGVYVRNPDAPEWGLGQVQSAIGMRVTVNFENEGKLVLNTEHVSLHLADD